LDDQNSGNVDSGMVWSAVVSKGHRRRVGCLKANGQGYALDVPLFRSETGYGVRQLQGLGDFDNEMSDVV